MQVLTLYFNELPSSLISTIEYDIHPLGYILQQMQVKNEMQRSYKIEGYEENIFHSNPHSSLLYQRLIRFAVKVIKHCIDPQEKNPLGLPLIKRDNQKLILNLYGFGKGATGIMLLANKLKKYTADQVEINMVVFDPLSLHDIPPVDLRKSTNINKVLFLYTEGENTLNHAPLPRLHSNTCYRIDVLPGNHRLAQEFHFLNKSVLPCNSNNAFREQTENILSFQSVVHFLEGCGTRFNFNAYHMDGIYRKDPEQNKQFLIKMLNHAKNSFLKKSVSLGRLVIVNPQGSYLNRLHQELLTGQPVFDTHHCVLSLKNETSFPENPHPFSRVFDNNDITPLPQPALLYDAKIIGAIDAQESTAEKLECSLF